MTRRIVIRSDGSAQFVYSDELKPLAAALGTAETRRASHVEPYGDGRWYADLRPSGGPWVVNFATRADAIAFEIDWLDKNLIR